jgi:hypothetical protein
MQAFQMQPRFLHFYRKNNGLSKQEIPKTQRTIVLKESKNINTNLYLKGQTNTR